MLATLGGPGVAEQLLGQESAAPLGVGSPSGRGDDDHGSEGDDSREAHNEGEESGPRSAEERALPGHAEAAWYETLSYEESLPVPVDSPGEAIDAATAGAGSPAAADTEDSQPNSGRTTPVRGRRNRPA